jgi:hypothetical protein
MIDLMYIAMNWLRAVLLLFLVIAFGGIFAWCMNQSDTIMNVIGLVMLFVIAPVSLLLIGNSLWPKTKKETRE